MIGYVEAQRAFWMTNGMARTVDVNLTSAVVEGWLSRAELVALVARCEVCAKTAECSDWLARITAGPVPEFCANKQPLEVLAPGA